MDFTGCGGEAVVHIGGAVDASISKATLGHWMQAMMGGDFRQSIGVQGPRGLVSEPADYPRCIDAAKLVAPRSFFNQLQLSRPELDRACHELYRAVKAQALRFLISAQWNIAEAAEQKVKITDGEVKRALEKLRSSLYPSERDLQRYLAERQWSLSDLLYQLRSEMLVRRLHPGSGTSVQGLGEGVLAYAPLAGARREELVAVTWCARGYLVPGCSAYRGSGRVSLSPGAILERLVRKRR